MANTTSIQRDVFIALALCGVGYWTARLVHKQLLAVQEFTIVKHKPKTGPERQDEDSLTLETLENLLPNANRDIAAAYGSNLKSIYGVSLKLTLQRAVKIVAERAARGRTYELLLRHIIGDDEEKRDKALVSLCYLHERLDYEVVKVNFSTFKAVILCLCKPQMQAEALEFESKVASDIPIYRTPHYYDALRLLRQIIIDADDGIREAIRAGLVSEWLVNYPWQGISGQKADIQEVVKKRMQWRYNDTDMNWILRTVAKSKKRYPSDHGAGIVQMEKHGLLNDTASDESLFPATWRPDLVRPNFREHIPSMAQSAPTTPLLLEDGTEIIESSQAREESVEEQMLRRRRREAMVLEDEGMPLSSANIIERATPEPESPAVINQRRTLEEQSLYDDIARQIREGALSLNDP